MGDAVINAAAPTLPRAQTRVEASLTLFAQLVMRALIMLLLGTLITSTPRWADTSAVDAMLDFRGALGLGMFSIFTCLLLRVYVITLISDKDVRAHPAPHSPLPGPATA